MNYISKIWDIYEDKYQTNSQAEKMSIFFGVSCLLPIFTIVYHFYLHSFQVYYYRDLCYYYHKVLVVVSPGLHHVLADSINLEGISN